MASNPELKKCMDDRFGADEVRRGPRVVCRPNPNLHNPPCAHYDRNKKTGIHGEITIFIPGGPSCPKFQPGEIVLHEVLHSCGIGIDQDGLEKHDIGFNSIADECGIR